MHRYMRHPEQEETPGDVKNTQLWLCAWIHKSVPIYGIRSYFFRFGRGYIIIHEGRTALKVKEERMESTSSRMGCWKPVTQSSPWTTMSGLYFSRFAR